MSLTTYKQKRNFKKTKEPEAKLAKKTGSSFVVQKHHASHLHYDFRLELGGVLKSWAVPKGPSLDPQEKRLAVQVEDHPVDYATFEGEIPKEEYGGGHVIVWDIGSWSPLSKEPLKDLKNGRLEFELLGEKLKGKWILVRTRGSSSKTWLLMKRSDSDAKPGSKDELIKKEPQSVLSDRTVEDLQAGVTALKRKTVKKVLTKKKTLPKKVKTELPKFVEPQLATLRETPPLGPTWVHEVKLDGYRTLCRIENGKVTLLTRSGLDWTKKYGALSDSCRKLKVKNALIDGEIVSLDEEGRSDFHALQTSLKTSKTETLLFYAFDLLFLDDQDLQAQPLTDRKAKLAQIIAESKVEQVVFSQHFKASGKDLLQASCGLKLEGIVSKQTDAEYQSGRSEVWIKTKCGHNEEFIIAGFTKPQGARSKFGALLLAAYDESDDLKYVGKIGTGFSETTLRTLYEKMRPLIQNESPFNYKVPEASRATWLKPSLIAQIKFASFTDDGIIRHGSFTALREDKPAHQVTIVGAIPKKAPKKIKSSAPQKRSGVNSEINSTGGKVGGVTISSASREVVPGGQPKITKGDLAQYYDRISPRLLPFIKNRPLSLLRCPDGAGAKCFFQKHLDLGVDSEIQSFDVSVQEREAASERGIYIDSKSGIVSLVQMGVVEIHAWGSHLETIERADNVIFDLDPNPGVSWSQVMEGALALKETLETLKLVPFLKVTGGKGLHIHVPIDPIYKWDDVKLFTKTIGSELAQKQPKLYTTRLLKKDRTGKVFIDYLRNGFGATAVAPYSVRAREGGAVALPIAWSALNLNLKPDGFFMKDAIDALKKADSWKNFEISQRKISVLDEYSKTKMDLKTKQSKKRR